MDQPDRHGADDVAAYLSWSPERRASYDWIASAIPELQERVAWFLGTLGRPVTDDELAGIRKIVSWQPPRNGA